VGGIEPNGEPFVGLVTMLGVHCDDRQICTGFAAHLAYPMLRERQSSQLSEADAKALMMDALRVLCPFLHCYIEYF
jgi:20S proteasome alpha/beta subunit